MIRARKLLGALLGGASLASGVFLLATSAWLISMASTKPPVLTLEVAVVSVRFFALARGVFRYAERTVSHDAMFRALALRRRELFRKLEDLTPALFSRGEMLTRVVNESEVEQDLWIRAWLPLLSAAFSASCGVGILWWLSPAAGAVALLFAFLGITVTPLLTWRISAKVSAANLENESEIALQITQICDVLPEALAYGAESELRASFATLNAASKRLDSRTANGAGLGSAFVFAITGATILFNSTIALREFGTHALAGVNVALLILVPLALFEGIAGLPAAATSYAKAKIARDHLREIESRTNPLPTPTKTIDPAALRLTLTNASAYWPGYATTMAPLSFELSLGETREINLPSGAGKSTLGLALAGLLPYDGSITLNGVEVRDIKDLSHFVHYDPQQAHLFNSTIRNNLTLPGGDYSDEELLKLLDVVGMRDFVESLPEGLSTIMGEYGHELSGGERRRLALARALLSTALILILDEPTESLTRAEAQSILEKVTNHARKRALIIIHHAEATSSYTP